MYSKKNSIRNINLDLIRVIAMILVVMVHIPVMPFQNNDLIHNTLKTIFLSCNSLFFMLSGYFNLNETIYTKKEYKKYYIKKFFSIILPYIIISFLLYTWKFYILPRNKIETITFFSKFYQYFMSGKIEIHLWFMYPLIGYLISAPFLGKAFQKMTNQELKLLLKIAIIWNIVSINLSKNLNIEFAYSGWLLSGWIISFYAGYYCRRVINNKNKKKLYVIGIICFLITILCKTMIPNHFNNSNDLSFLFVLFTMSLFVFLEKEVKIKYNLSKRIISFLAKYSFLIYLFHWNVLFNIVLVIFKDATHIYSFLLITFLTVIISLAFSIATKLFILKPISYLAYKIFDNS